MYKNKIVCALKHNNTPLAEDKDTVFIPFNTEYSIFLKNMNDTIAYVSIFIDGKDINPGKKIKIYPKCSTTIEKFPLTNHRFIFKERTRSLQEVRLNQDEDGLIRLEVAYQVKSYINGDSIIDRIKPCITNPYLDKSSPFGPKISPFYSPPMSPHCNGNYFDGDSISTPKEVITNSIKAKLNDEINSKKNEDKNFVVSNSLAVEDYSSSIFSQAAEPIFSQAAEAEPIFGKVEEMKNTGFTAPGKIKIENDNLSSYQEKDCISQVGESFSFVIRLEDTNKPLANKEIKKICPTCEKKFKNKYFYCPFDGTFLDEEK